MWRFLGNVVATLTLLGIAAQLWQHPLAILIPIGLLCLVWGLRTTDKWWNDK